MHRDTLQTGTTKSPSERFLNGVKRSHMRINRLENHLIKQLGVESEAAGYSESPVTASTGEYVMELSLGTPPQKFSTIVDTGSDLTWVQCSPCSVCFEQPNPLFDPRASSTYSQTKCDNGLCKILQEGLFVQNCKGGNTCNYTYSYGDGSNTLGVLSLETVTLGSSSVPDVGIGCGHSNQGSFAGADGIVGLGQGSLSLPSQLKPSIAQIFSYCLVDLSSTASTSSPITFGDARENSDAKYTPLVANSLAPTYYYVGVEGISVGRQKVEIPDSAFEISEMGSGGVILDSGTTITYWMSEAFTPMLAAFREQISYPETNAGSYFLDLCYDISNAAADGSLNLPSMVVHFTDVDFEIPMPNLWVLVEDTGSVVCLAMAESEQFSIIGNIQQQNNLIVYDVVNQRVGFKPVRCDGSSG
ncbi:hypothetical protein M758_4G153600 [Ceratodon purpureus]|nr:hypothetical protein M758_4G153600 [Ceratodon purpureus]